MITEQTPRSAPRFLTLTRPWGVRWGALFNPIRRPDWIKDAPAVLVITGRLALRGVSVLVRLFS
jgi:hypothetical protein